MKTISYLLVALLSIGSLVAQEDLNSEAKMYLDLLNTKNKTYHTVEIELDYSVVNVNSAQQSNISQNLNIKIKGDKYYLKMDDTDIIFDGEAIYSVSFCEALINDVPEDADFNQGITLMNLLTFTTDYSYFSHKMVKEITLDGKEVVLIEMTPKNRNEAQFYSITLTLDKNKMEPYRVEIKAREGWVYHYKFKKMVVNQSLADALFKFEISNFPCVEEILDLREN